MRYIVILFIFFYALSGCEKVEDSDALFNKAEGFVKLNMYREALDIYVELKSRNYKVDIIDERIKTISTKLAEETLKKGASRSIEQSTADRVDQSPQLTGSAGTGYSFKVSKCDKSYNERILQIKNEMKPYQDELNELEQKLSKISSEYKVVNIDGGYSFAVPADTPKEKQKEIAEGPARDFGTLMARKNELMSKINKYNQDINTVLEDAKKAGQPSDCIKR